MTLAPFASSLDVAIRLGRTLSASESSQVDAFLGDASAQIRDYCRQDLSYQTGLVFTVESPDGPWLELPQRPVNSVTSVAINGQAVGNYTQVGDRLYRVYGWAWPSVDVIPPMAVYGLMSTVTVTYDAGYSEVPQIIVSVCIGAAMRAFDNPMGVAREAIDDYSRELPAGAVGTGAFLTDADMKRLRRYRRGAFSVDMGSGWV